MDHFGDTVVLGVESDSSGGRHWFAESLKFCQRRMGKVLMGVALLVEGGLLVGVADCAVDSRQLIMLVKISLEFSVFLVTSLF